ncbi:Tetratricopeptide-like helical domain superfamily [Sesbania bispinosa]|nr:Tetratricopeptide-like helical domain superfamily [Sesbania bispinosa]
MSSNSKPLKLLSRLSFRRTHSQTALTSKSKHHDDNVVAALCDWFRRGRNWDAVSRKFGSVELNDSLVERVLLELKDAKAALGFFHWSAKTNRFQLGVRSYCIAINVLVRAGLVTDARALLESLANKNSEPRAVRAVVDSMVETYEVVGVSGSHPPVFDRLIQSYAKLRLTDVAFAVCRYVEERGFRVSLASFNVLLHVAQRSNRCELVWEVYEHMVGERNYPNTVTFRIMIDALCKEGLLQRNVDTLDRIMGKRSSHSPSAIVNSSLIFKMLDKGHVERVVVMVVTLLKRLLQQNLIPDSVGYSLIVHAKIRAVGGVFGFFDEMLSAGFVPSCLSFEKMVEKLCENGDVNQANVMLTVLLDKGFLPSDVTYSHLVHGYARKDEVQEMLKLYYEMEFRSIVRGLSVFSSIIQCLCRCGKLEDAEKFLRIMKGRLLTPNVTIYKTLINGHVQKGNDARALQLRNEMASLEL